MSAAERARFAARLRDPAGPRDGAVESRRKGAFLLRALVLQRLAAALRRAGLRALLVKGAALALTHYAPPWSREMDDVDLLVRAKDHDAVVRTLVAAGFVPGEPTADRALSRGMFHETQLYAQLGPTGVLVEVHDALDKLVARAVRYEAIFARATAAPGLDGLLVPCPEDHALLVVLHAAGHELRHEVGLVDLDRLLASGLDVSILEAHARAARLETALYVALSALDAAGSPHVPAELLRRLAPSPLRAGLLALVYAPRDVPIAKSAPRLGLPWVLRQIPLRDDLLAYASGVFRYAAVRALERARGA